MTDSLNKEDIRLLSEEELATLRLEINKKRDFLLFEILYETGCKVQELVQLRVRDIGLENTLCFTNRECRISSLLATELRVFIGSKDIEQYVFSTRQSDIMTKKRVRQIVQSSTTKILGRKVNPQLIRYTHISHAMSRGVPMEKIRLHIGLQKLRAKQLKEIFSNEK